MIVLGQRPNKSDSDRVALSPSSPDLVLTNAPLDRHHPPKYGSPIETIESGSDALTMYVVVHVCRFADIGTLPFPVLFVYMHIQLP